MDLRAESDESLWERGLKAFAERDFYDVHEYFEELWRRAPAADKLPLQGLLQAAVCLYHFTRGNFAGARILRPQAIDKLSRSPAAWRGIDVADYVARFEASTRGLLSPEVESLDPANAPVPERT